MISRCPFLKIWCVTVTFLFLSSSSLCLEHSLISRFYFLNFSLFFGCITWCVWSYFPNQGLEPGPLHWKCRVLTTGSLWKSPFSSSIFFFPFLVLRETHRKQDEDRNISSMMEMWCYTTCYMMVCNNEISWNCKKYRYRYVHHGADTLIFISYVSLLELGKGDFPGGSVVKALYFQFTNTYNMYYI